MATFYKPENALKRAEELVEVGKKQDALDTLHAAMQTKKVKNMWTQTNENIMVRHLELCVDLKKMKTAREGLYQYRTMCQAANIGSLETVVQHFRKAAEEKVSEAKAKAECDAEVDDLEEMESPQAILLKAIQAHDTRQQSQDRDLHMHFRFLWDTYKVILDVLKSHAHLEEVYHETAKTAFEFCRVNKRPQEFKRLCETLRKNWQDLQKPSGKTRAHEVDCRNADTITRTLETRCRQMQICTELDLWRESYTTATEIHDLMSKAPRTKPLLRSMYYEYLGQIFWKSENHLFHAFACLKNLQFVKAAKPNITKEELQLLASKAVLATLCVPFSKQSDIHSSLELTTEGASSPYEKAKKHAMLFSSASVPTREAISQALVEKNLLPLASEPCRKLFNLIEADFTPLSLCQDSKPFLDDIVTGNLFDGKLESYITPLKQIIFFRLMKQLSEVYANMTIDNFEHAASIVPFSIAEKWMANAARQHGINIQINYSDKAIVFGAPRKVDMKSMRQPLIEMGRKLQQALQRVAPEEQHKKEKRDKHELAQHITRRVSEETNLIRFRKEEIERRKEESEKRKEQQDAAQLAAQRKQEEAEMAQERERQEKERIQREKDREAQRKKEQEELRTSQLVAEMTKQAANNPFLKKALNKLEEEKGEIKAQSKSDFIRKAHQEQIQRERAEKIRQRKLEAKRIDHLARALREEEQKNLDRWADEVEKADQTYIDAEGAKEIEEKRALHEVALEERDMLRKFVPATESWAEPVLRERLVAHEKALEDRKKRCLDKAIEQKIQRARARAKGNAAIQADERRAELEREEAERQEIERKRKEKEDEERRQREEEEDAERRAVEAREREERERERERRRAEREAEQERLNEVAERQRKKEQEIEEKQRAEAEERAQARPAPRRDDREDRGPPRRDDRDDRGPPRREDRDDRGPARRDDRDDRDDRGPPRRDGGDDEKDNWRSGGGGPRRMDSRRDDRDDRGPPRRDDRDDRDRRDDRGGDDWRSAPRSNVGGRDRDDDRRPGGGFGDRRPGGGFGDRDRRDDGPRTGGGGGGWRDREDRDDRGPIRRDDRGPPRRDDGPRSGGGGWRDREDRDDRGPPRRDDRDDRGPPRRDDRDDRGPPRRDDGPRSGGGGWRDRDDRDDRGPPRRDDRDDRGPPRRDDGDSWRKPAAGGDDRDRGAGRSAPARRDEPEDRGGAWRSGGGDRGEDRAPPARSGTGGGSAWGRGPPAGDRDAGGDRGGAGGNRGGDRDDGPRRPSAPAAAPVPKEEPKAPAPAPEEPAADDDGFETVAAGKKKKGKR